MLRSMLILLAVTTAMTLVPVDTANAIECPNLAGVVYGGSWNSGYYHTAWGMPMAVLVPPTAEAQTHYGWGVGNTRVTKIWPQFRRDYPGPGVYERGMYRPTPVWPSDTDQFGAYYVRGPW